MSAINEGMKIQQNDPGSEPRDQLKVHDDYWLDKVVPLPQPLTIPTTGKNQVTDENLSAPVAARIVKSVLFSLDGDLVRKIGAQASRSHCSSREVILSLYFLLLNKVTHQDDLCIAIQTANARNVANAGLLDTAERLLPIRAMIDQEHDFSNLVNSVHDACAQANANDDVCFGQIFSSLGLDRNTASTALFNALVIFEDLGCQHAHVDHSVEQLVIEERTSNLVLHVTESEEIIHCSFKYDTHWIDEGAVRDLAGYFENLVATVCATSSETLGALSLLTQNEQRVLLHDFNDTWRDYDLSGGIDDAFSRSARVNAEREALVACDCSLSYAELDRKSDVLARELTRCGATSGDYIGILLQRNSQLIVSLLAVLKCGAAYIPMDPEYPAERLKHMLSVSEAKLLVSTTDLASELDFTGQLVNPYTYDESAACHIELAKTDSGRKSNTAYVIFTSGSTGVPKGVVIEHGNVINFVESMHDELPLVARSRVLGLTTASFDIFVLEVFLTLLKGHTLVLATEKEQKDPHALAEFIDKYKTNVVQVTPSRLQVLAAGNIPFDQFLHGVDLVLIGGEAFPQQHLEDLQALQDLRVFNMYGPTETTVWSCICDMSERSDVTMGRPIGNTQVLILGERNELLPQGSVGKLFIGGLGLARGYLNDTEKTANVYIDNPFDPGTRIYETGDLASWTDAGELVYHGRSDSQIKHLGYRIELLEIDVALNKCDGVGAGCVVVRELSPGNSVLVAFCTSSSQPGDIEFNKRIKEKLVAALPRYMVPDYVVRLDALPLTPNSKIDRGALPDSVDFINGAQKESNEMEIDTDDSLMHFLCDSWVELLNTTAFTETTSFFDAGGNSYSLVLLHRKIDNQYPDCLEIADIFANPTLRALHYALSMPNQAESVALGNAANENDGLSIIFPDHYFVARGKLQEPEYFRFGLKQETWLATTALQDSHKIGVTDALVGILGLYINKLIGTDSVVLQKRQDQKLLVYRFNFSEIQTLEELLEFAASRDAANEDGSCNFAEYASEHKTEFGHSLRLVFDAEAGSSSLASLALTHDIVLTLDDQTRSIRVDFDHQRLDAGQVFKFASDYMKLLDNLVPSMHATIH